MSGEHAGRLGDDLSVPAMPIISPSEQTLDVYPLWMGRHGIGWQFPAQRDRGPAFVALGKGALGGMKVLDRFPLTEAGWVLAWNAVARVDPEAARRIRGTLAERDREAARLAPDRVLVGPEVAVLDSRSLASLPGAVLLGGYAAVPALVIGERYDVRFLEDRLAAYWIGRPAPRAEVPFAQIEVVEIGGPGLVKSGGGFVGGGFGAVGALEGMAVAAVLNALTTRTSITTIVRVQGTDCEMFFLHTKSTPEQLRMEMSAALGAIRAAHTVATGEPAPSPPPAAPASPVEELAKLADMLAAGLITRAEFDQLKARILQG